MAEWTIVEDEEELKRLAAERISVPPPQEDRIPLESELGNEWEKVEEPPQFEKEPGGFFATEESEARNQGLGPSAELTESQARGTANRNRLSSAIAQTEQAGYDVPHFIGTDNEPEGDRGPTMDMENLAAALKKQQEDQEAAGNKAKAEEVAKERAYWEDKIKTEGMSAEQWKQQTGEDDPSLWEKVEGPPAAEEWTKAHSVGIVTAYRPGGTTQMGLSPTVEGGNVDAHGEPIVGRTTVEDYLQGNGDYVTVAMDKTSSWQNQFLSSPNFPGMVFRVRDNGGYGNNKTGENWVDVAFSDPQRAKSMLLRGVPFTPISVDEAQKISESRPNLAHTPRLQALYVPGGSFSYEETPPEGGPPDPFIEFSARTVRGVEMGTREMFGGVLSMTEAATRGERNVYLDEEKSEEKAEGDIPMLEEQIASLTKQMRDQVLKDDPEASKWVNDTTFDSPEIQKLDKQLRQARRAAAGDLQENMIGALSRQTERLASEAEKNQVAAAKKYAPYISQAGDTKWGFMLADALGRTIPGVLASVANPVFGASTIYAQIYQASLQQYMAEKPEATREEAQKFANDQALAQTPWAIAGNQLTARALKASFASLPAGAVERGSRIFGTQVGQAVAKNAQAFIGNVGSAVGQSIMSDMVSEDYDLLEDTDLGEKFKRSLEPASLAGGVSLIFGGAGMAGAVAKRPGAAKPKAETAKPAAPKEEIKSFQELPPAEEIRFAPKAPPAPEGAVTEPFMPTVVVNGEPFTASSHAGAVVQAVKKHGKEATAKGDSGFLDDQGRFVSSRTNDIEDRLSAAIRDDLPPDEIAAIEKRLDQSRAQDEKVPLKEKAPEEKPAPAAKPAGFLKLDKPAIDQDFGPEWKNEVSNAYDEVKTGSSYITEVTGADMFKHFARDFPGENWRQDTANFMRRHFGIEGAKFTHKGDEHTIHFKEKPPEKFSREEGELALAVPKPPIGPPRTSGAGVPPALPPSPSIVGPVAPPKGIGPSIAPLWQNPLLRRHITYAPGQTKEFLTAQSPIRQWQRFFIGTAEVFENAPGLEPLGKAIRNYVDDRAMFKGRDAEPFRQWEKNVTSQQKTQAHQESGRFFLQANDPDVNVQRQAVPTYWAASPKGRELIDLQRDFFNRTGIEHQALGLFVFDATLNKFRPIGKIAGGGDPIPPKWYPGWKPGYFPRMIAKGDMEIIRDPKGNPAAYEALKDEIEAMGFLRDSIDHHIANIARESANNEFFASVDSARTAKLPQTRFDYSFETTRRYISARAERVAQIKNFGQKTAHSGPESQDLFEQYHEIAGDQHTRDYINYVREQVLNVHLTHDDLTKAGRSIGTVLTGLHLGNPITASRNLASGQAMIGTKYGFKHYAKGVEESFRNIDDAYEKGIIIEDMMNLLEQAEGLGPAQKFTNLMLKYSGEMPAENFNRLVNMGAAKSMLRDAIAEYQRNPLSRKSRQYFGDIKRLGGIDPQALIDEGGVGPLTDRYLRQSVKQVQGGYQIDQTPAFQNTDKARFFFKYSKWGTQQLDFFSKEVIRPAIRELSEGKAKRETVEIRDPTTGKMVTKEVPGDLSKAVRYFTLLSTAGMGAAAFAFYVFGTEDRTESWTEIIRKSDKDQQAAFFDALHKLFQYQIVMGVGGSLSNVAQIGLDWTQKVRFKDPLNPPVPEIIRDTANLVSGPPSLRELDQYLRRNVSGYRSAKQFAAYWGNDVVPLGFRELKRESMLQDLKWLRGVTQRYEKEMKVSAPSPWRPGAASQSPMSRFNYNIKEALLIGDVQGAKRLKAERFAKLTLNQREVAMDSLMDSVRSGRPIKVGGSTSEAATAGFLRWADTNMSKADAAKLRRMDKTYRDTAVAAGILKPGKGETTTSDIEEQLRGMQMRTELRETP